MAGPPTPTFSQLVCKWAGPALPFGAVTTHGFDTPQGDLQTVLNAIGQFGEDLATEMSDTVTIQEVDWKVGPVATGTTVTVPVGVTGTRTGQVSPPNVCSLVKLAPFGVSGRFGGRFYLPGVPEESTDIDGALSPSYRDALEVKVLEAYASMDFVGSQPYIFPVGSSDAREVVNISVDGRTATQRRRLRR